MDYSSHLFPCSACRWPYSHRPTPRIWSVARSGRSCGSRSRSRSVVRSPDSCRKGAVGCVPRRHVKSNSSTVCMFTLLPPCRPIKNRHYIPTTSDRRKWTKNDSPPMIGRSFHWTYAKVALCPTVQCAWNEWNGCYSCCDFVARNNHTVLNLNAIFICTMA